MEDAITALREQRRTQVAERLRAGERYRDLDLVFATKEGQPLEWRIIAQRYFRPFIRELGLPPIRPYDLRHSHATHLLQAGVHPKVVAERLGHSSITITLDTYSHVLPGMQESAVRRLEGLLLEKAGNLG